MFVRYVEVELIGEIKMIDNLVIKIKFTFPNVDSSVGLYISKLFGILAESHVLVPCCSL